MVTGMTETSRAAELPLAADRLIGASCTLGAAEMRERLLAWRALHDRALATDPTPSGVRLVLATDEPMDELARLVELEAACCAFYDFTLRMGGTARELEIGAGPDGGPAVRALLGIDEGR
jgi:hypothetical protein